MLTFLLNGSGLKKTVTMKSIDPIEKILEVRLIELFNKGHAVGHRPYPEIVDYRDRAVTQARLAIEGYYRGKCLTVEEIVAIQKKKLFVLDSEVVDGHYMAAKAIRSKQLSKFKGGE